MANTSHCSYFSSFYNDGRMFSPTPASSVIDLCRGKLFFVLFCSQGGLRNSKHEFTLSSQEYVHELRSGITEEKLFHCLESLRVSLTSNPVRLVVPASFTLRNCVKTSQFSTWGIHDSFTEPNKSHRLTAERGCLDFSQHSL